MADEKKKGAASLYDNERSMKRETPKERDKEAAATAESDMERGDKPKADKSMKPVEKASDKFLEELRGLHKMHEAERRDAHGNHKEVLRQMQSRHEKAFAQLIEKHHAPGEGNANEADGGESMPGGMAVVDGVEA